MTARGRRRIFGAVLVMALTAALLSLALGGGDTNWTAVAAVLVATTVSEARLLHLAFGRERWSFAWSELPIAAALVVTTSSALVLAVAGGVLLAQLGRRASSLKVIFNVAQFAAATACAVSAAALVDHGVGGAAAGMAVFFAVNTGAVAYALSSTLNQSWPRLVAEAFPLTVLPYAANASLGVLAGFMTHSNPAGALLMLAPLVALWSGHIERTRKATESSILVELGRVDAVAVGSVDHVAKTAVGLAARSFGQAEVHLVLMAPEGLVEFVSDAEGIRRAPATTKALDTAEVATVLGRGHGTGRDASGRPWAGVALSSKGQPRGALVVHRTDTVDRFGRSDVTVLGSLGQRVVDRLERLELGQHGERAVNEAGLAQVPSQGGVRTTPVLLTLRDASRRLLASTQRSEPVGDEIVRELAAVESAVASLLGGMTIAAEEIA